jgi:hypothetical protein
MKHPSRYGTAYNFAFEVVSKYKCLETTLTNRNEDMMKLREE